MLSESPAVGSVHGHQRSTARDGLGAPMDRDASFVDAHLLRSSRRRPPDLRHEDQPLRALRCPLPTGPGPGRTDGWTRRGPGRARIPQLRRHGGSREAAGRR